jgi:putative tryptophan/tyrosine transport system substrate-binding protein
MIKRREFIAGVAGAAAWPLGARAQQPPVPVVGFLHGGSPHPPWMAAFGKGLSEAGFVEGQNVAVEYRWAEDEGDRLPALAVELVRRRVAVIYADGGSSSALAAKAATATIPIVFVTATDPVQDGLVASFNRPGGNVTGISRLNRDLTGKRLALLHELVPVAVRFAVLVYPGVPRVVASAIADAQAAASALGRLIEVYTASSNREIDAAFASFVQNQADALLIGTGPLFFDRRAQLAMLAASHALPAIHFAREFVEAGGLMSYGTSITDTARQGGIYVGRILKGEKPADLPVQQATRFEFVINLTTAKALGLTIPETLLATADEVIE